MGRGGLCLVPGAGANVANDVAREEFAEATIGHSPDETDTALVWQQLFDTPYFKVNTLPDIAGVQVRTVGVIAVHREAGGRVPK